jgi:hypothetical protein
VITDSPRLLVVTRALTHDEMRERTGGVTVTAWLTEALSGFSEEHLDLWTHRRFTAIVIARGELNASATTAALYSDFLALHDDAQLTWKAADRGTKNEELAPRAGDPRPEARVIPAVVWRARQRALRILMNYPYGIDTASALREELADVLVPAGSDSVEWLRNWLGTRSLPALDSAAKLIRGGGAYSMERIEFARLFSTGEPQRGLARFLGKEPLDFSNITLETI